MWILHDLQRNTRHILKPGATYLIGRKGSNFLPANENDKSVSRQHAELRVGEFLPDGKGDPANNPEVFIKDKGSRFNTTLNPPSDSALAEGSPLPAPLPPNEEVSLRDGDILLIGRQGWTLRVQLERIVVCFSGLSRSSRAELSQICRCLGISVVNDFANNCTHLVLSDPARVSAKLVQAAANCAPIINEGWIRALAAAENPSKSFIQPDINLYVPRLSAVDLPELSSSVSLKPNAKRSSILSRYLFVVYSEEQKQKLSKVVIPSGGNVSLWSPPQGSDDSFLSSSLQREMSMASSQVTLCLFEVDETVPRKLVPVIEDLARRWNIRFITESDLVYSILKISDSYCYPHKKSSAIPPAGVGQIWDSQTSELSAVGQSVPASSSLGRSRLDALRRETSGRGAGNVDSTTMGSNKFQHFLDNLIDSQPPISQQLKPADDESQVWNSYPRPDAQKKPEGGRTSIMEQSQVPATPQPRIVSATKLGISKDNGDSSAVEASVASVTPFYVRAERVSRVEATPIPVSTSPKPVAGVSLRHQTPVPVSFVPQSEVRRPYQYNDSERVFDTGTTPSATKADARIPVLVESEAGRPYDQSDSERAFETGTTPTSNKVDGRNTLEKAQASSGLAPSKLKSARIPISSDQIGTSASANSHLGISTNDLSPLKGISVQPAEPAPPASTDLAIDTTKDQVSRQPRSSITVVGGIVGKIAPPARLPPVPLRRLGGAKGRSSKRSLSPKHEPVPEPDDSDSKDVSTSIVWAQVVQYHHRFRKLKRTGLVLKKEDFTKPLSGPSSNDEVGCTVVEMIPLVKQRAEVQNITSGEGSMYEVIRQRSRDWAALAGGSAETSKKHSGPNFKRFKKGYYPGRDQLKPAIIKTVEHRESGPALGAKREMSFTPEKKKRTVAMFPPRKNQRNKRRRVDNSAGDDEVEEVIPSENDHSGNEDEEQQSTRFKRTAQRRQKLDDDKADSDEELRLQRLLDKGFGGGPKIVERKQPKFVVPGGSAQSIATAVGTQAQAGPSVVEEEVGSVRGKNVARKGRYVSAASRGSAMTQKRKAAVVSSSDDDDEGGVGAFMAKLNQRH